MNTPTPRTFDLHLPGSFGKVVSLDWYRATHKRNGRSTTSSDPWRSEPINCRCTLMPVIPDNDDPSPRAA